MAEDNRGEKSRNMVSSAGFMYSDVSSATNSNIQSQIPSFEVNPEMVSLTADMEMIGFPQKNLQQQTVMWKGLLGKGGGGGGCSKTADDFYDQAAQEFNNTSTTRNENLMVAPAGWQVEENRLMVDDPSSLRCTVFPCEGNERPSQGLSLSLSSANPSTIGLQSFQLRHQHQQGDDDAAAAAAAADHMRFFPPPNSTRDAFFGKSALAVQVQEQEDDGGWFLQSKAANQGNNNLLQLRSSKYLAPAQQLLQEFCNLGTKPHPPPTKHQKSTKTNQWEDENGTTTSSSSRKPSLYSLELVELQKRKSKLLSMLEEVDKRYKHYCDQMKAVVSSFESVAGKGAARVYSALASKAMSRHFRCLRDGIVSQIHETKKAMGEKDPVAVAPGASRGETPRLRLLDQALRQQRAFQQMTMIESHPWRPQRGLPERAVSVLRAWLFEHFLHPYPSDVDKHILARQTGLSRSQVSNWFINARVRLWKPMVEEMYMEETREVELESPGAGSQDEPPARLMQEDDQKPTAEQLVRIDSECLSSIINHPPDKNNNNNNDDDGGSRNGKSFQNHSSGFGRVADAFGGMELDFSSNYHGGGVGGGAVHSVSFTNHGSSSSSGHHQNFGGVGGVSLTLGLQQHGGVSLAFSPPSHNSALFYPRDPIEDCQSVPYSLLEGEAHNLPYRNLMGAQLLHDLAG